MSSTTLRVGVIGVGMMGADHADRLAHRVANATLVAVADPDQDRAQDLAAQYDGVQVFADPIELIHDDSVDAVLIASPGFVHEEQLLACIEEGKYALCEKPLTMDAESSRRILEAERAAGKPLVQVGFMRRFDPQYAAMKQMLDSGELGRLLLLHNVHRNKTVPDGFRSEMIVRDSLVHEVDVCRWLFGEEITEITVLSPAPTSYAAEGVVDPQVAIFRMEGGGLATTEVFVNSAVGYEVRCEASAELGNATVGLGSGAVRPLRQPLGRRRARRLPGAVRRSVRRRGPGLGRLFPPRRGDRADRLRRVRRDRRVRGRHGVPQDRGTHEGGAVVKLALDPYMFREVPLLQLPALVSDLGYEWIELSPREDFTPFFNHPRVDDATVKRFRKSLGDAGVGVSSILPLYKWSGPDEEERQAAVRYWKRAIEIASLLGVDRMNSEFNGNPRQADVCERMFWRSMEDLLPVFEKEGISLVLEPHPDDWEEDGKRAVDLIKGINSPLVSFLYCAPHTFHQGNDCAGIMEKAGDLLTMVHVADSFDHTGSSGLRYIVNPPGSQVTIHQHLDIGQGEVDFDEFFSTLEKVDFDGIVTSCVFAWEERARESSTFMRETIAEHLGRWQTAPSLTSP